MDWSPLDFTGICGVSKVLTLINFDSIKTAYQGLVARQVKIKSDPAEAN